MRVRVIGIQLRNLSVRRVFAYFNFSGRAQEPTARSLGTCLRGVGRIFQGGGGGGGGGHTVSHPLS